MRLLRITIAILTLLALTIGASGTVAADNPCDALEHADDTSDDTGDGGIDRAQDENDCSERLPPEPVEPVPEE